MAPHACDHDTKGLLYYDLRSSLMYRCDGGMWITWDHNQSHNQMYQTAPLSTAEADRDLPVNTKKECSQGKTSIKYSLLFVYWTLNKHYYYYKYSLCMVIPHDTHTLLS